MSAVENPKSLAIYQSLVLFDDLASERKMESDKAINQMTELLSHCGAQHHAYITKQATASVRGRIIVAIKNEAKKQMSAVQTRDGLKILLKNLSKDEVDCWRDTEGNSLRIHASKMSDCSEFFPLSEREENPIREAIRFILNTFSRDEIAKWKCSEGGDLIGYCFCNGFVEEALHCQQILGKN